MFNQEELIKIMAGAQQIAEERGDEPISLDEWMKIAEDKNWDKDVVKFLIALGKEMGLK